MCASWQGYYGNFGNHPHRVPTPADPWELAAQIAERPTDVAAWQRELAGAVAAAASPDAAAVSLCRLGNPAGATPVVAPLAQAPAGRRLVESLLPRVTAAGLEVAWAVSSATELGMIGRFLTSEEGMVAGWIVLLTRAPAHQRLTEIRGPFERLCRAAQVAVRGALAMAAAMGARYSRVSPASLSAREMEVANLAAGGFSDLNIATRLAISEGTVGRHLHSIYRKLGIGSRMQLSELLCIAA